jgi:hypothetical protein
LIGEGERTYAMFEHSTRCQWVLEPVKYRSLEHLLSIFDVRVLRAGYRRECWLTACSTRSCPDLR